MIALIVNDGTSLRRARPDLARIERELGGHGKMFVSRSAAELEQWAQDLAAQPPAHIATWGGDGTIQWTVSALIRAFGDQPLPPFSFLPAGTVNTIASGLGSTKRPLDALARLVRGHAELPLVRRTPICVDENAGFLFGIGIIPNALAQYGAGARVGARRALEVFASASRSLLFDRPDGIFELFSARVHATGPSGDRPSTLDVSGQLTNISAAGVEHLPFGFRPYDWAAEAPGSFHLIVHDLRARGALRSLARMAVGRAMHGMKGVKEARVSRVEIELEVPKPFALDGEILPPRSRLTLRAGPVLDIRVPTPR